MGGMAREERRQGLRRLDVIDDARTPSTTRMITRDRDAALISGLPHWHPHPSPAADTPGVTTWLPGPGDVRHSRSRAGHDAAAPGAAPAARGRDRRCPPPRCGHRPPQASTRHAPPGSAYHSSLQLRFGVRRLLTPRRQIASAVTFRHFFSVCLTRRTRRYGRLSDADPQRWWLCITGRSGVTLSSFAGHVGCGHGSGLPIEGSTMFADRVMALIRLPCTRGRCRSPRRRPP